MNLLYSQFLKAYMTKSINLVATPDEPADIFKLALINQDAIDAQITEPTGAGNFTKNICLSKFQDLQEQGAEVESVNYEPGGKEVVFTKTTGNFGDAEDEVQEYSDGLPRIFYNLNKAINFGTQSAPVRFTAGGAVIYRVSDGLLVAYYQFNEPAIVNGVFSMTWGGKHVLAVKMDIYDTNQGSSVANIDTEMNPTSNNPISNKAVTQALFNLGTRLGLKIKNATSDDDDIESADEAIHSQTSSLDELSSLTREELSSIFEEVISELSGS